MKDEKQMSVAVTVYLSSCFCFLFFKRILFKLLDRKKPHRRSLPIFVSYLLVSSLFSPLVLIGFISLLNDVYCLLNCFKKTLQVTCCKRYDDGIVFPFSPSERGKYGAGVVFLFPSRFFLSSPPSFWREKLSTGRCRSCFHVSKILLFPHANNNRDNNDSISNR